MRFTTTFTILPITILMGVFLSSMLQVEKQQDQLIINQHIIDSLLIVNTFPSPAQDDLFIKYDSPEDDFEILVFNELGQQVRLGTVSTELVSTKTLHLNIASLQNGVYFLVLQNEKQKLVQRFMVLK